MHLTSLSIMHNYWYFSTTIHKFMYLFINDNRQFFIINRLLINIWLKVKLKIFNFTEVYLNAFTKMSNITHIGTIYNNNNCLNIYNYQISIIRSRHISNFSSFLRIFLTNSLKLNTDISSSLILLKFTKKLNWFFFLNNFLFLKILWNQSNFFFKLIQLNLKFNFKKKSNLLLFNSASI